MNGTQRFARALAMKIGVLAVLTLSLVGSAQADELVPGQAFKRAAAIFEQALSRLDGREMGVDVAAYRDALTLRQFRSTVWGGEITVDVRRQAKASGGCNQFAAYVRVPPQDGVVPLVLCPKFFTEGNDELRALTILHEIVHVVAGPDECQAMAFAARVQQAATGQFTPVNAYWRASGCVGSLYRLPD